MGITYVSGPNLQQMTGVQMQQSASTPRAAADTGHAILWPSTTDGEWRATDDTGAGVVFATTTASQTLTNKTLTQPVIGNFTSATHTHQNNAGGGQLDAAAIATGTLANGRVNWAAPSAIGSTTPAAGTFTSMTISTATGITINGGSSSPFIVINANAATQRGINFQSASSIRWSFQVEETAESGSNAGSDLRLINYTDAGGVIGVPFFIKRSTGNVTFGGNISLFGATVPTRPTYGAPTGTATRTTFDTTTVTLAQLAERVKAIIDDFRSRGDFA